MSGSGFTCELRGGPCDGITTTWPPPEEMLVPPGWTADMERSGHYVVVEVDDVEWTCVAEWDIGTEVKH